MRRKLHRYTGNQWDVCQRCGQLYTMPELTLQKGMLLCTAHCTDNLDVEQRGLMIERVLSSGIDQEGADQRQDYWTLFGGWDYEEG